VLTLSLAAGIEADDCDAVGSIGGFGALHHELPAQYPLEDGAASGSGRSSRKRCLYGPLADEHLQALHRGTPGGVVPFHVCPPSEAMIQALTIADRPVPRKSPPEFGSVRETVYAYLSHRRAAAGWRSPRVPRSPGDPSSRSTGPIHSPSMTMSPYSASRHPRQGLPPPARP
jgi:hypothetical protein